MSAFQSQRGMRDLLPDSTPRWRLVETACVSALQRYGYREIRLPLLEDTGLFKRGVGEATDIVEKEMFSFPSRDPNDDGSLTLRPEGTAGCARALQQHGLLYNQTQKVWYSGPMFRYERPQKGRYRQFEQIGAEVFGIAEPAVEAELIALCASAFAEIGVLGALHLELNTLGSGSDRRAYREALVEYLQSHFKELDADSQRRLDTNPLRILDSKVPETQAILAGAPALPDYVDAQAREHFAELQRQLDALGIAYRRNSGLVRGLDYYTHTVFEWTTEALGAQGTVCGGGRYDGLVELLGGRPTPGAGFAMGVDRLVLLHEVVQGEVDSGTADVYVVCAGAAEQAAVLQLAERLRAALPRLRVQTHLGAGKLKAQMKRADASGATVALILGEAERLAGEVTVKWLRGHPAGEADQQRLPEAGLAAALEPLAAP